MRIVFFLVDFGQGGAETVVLRLCNYLSDKGHEVLVLTIKSKDQLSQRLNTEARLTTFSKTRIMGSFIPLIRFMRTENIDIFFANMWPLTVVAVMASFFCPGFRRKLFLIEHANLGEESKQRSKLFKLSQRLSISFLYNRVHKVITVSNGVREDLISKGLKREKTKVIYDPAYPNLAEDKVHCEEGKKKWFKQDCLKIAAVGHPHRQKNYPNLINAVEILKNTKKIDCQVIIVGEGPEKNKIEALVHQKKLTNEITLVGYVPNPISLIEESDLLVLSSSYEGFGMVIVEALSVGKTVVSTDCPSGPSEIIGDNEFGYLCKVDNPSDLAEKIEYAKENNIDPEKLINRSKEFSLDKIGPLYEAILDTSN
jgi:glycosyltransferase involved in cell wall biosynthesis